MTYKPGTSIHPWFVDPALAEPEMRRFSCSATYATPTGRAGRRTFLVDAPTISEAIREAKSRLARYSKVDIAATDIGPAQPRKGKA